MARKEKLHEFGAYRKAFELFDSVFGNLAPLTRKHLIPQSSLPFFPHSLIPLFSSFLR